jgi:hypothetical protein
VSGSYVPNGGLFGFTLIHPSEKGYSFAHGQDCELTVEIVAPSHFFDGLVSFVCVGVMVPGHQEAMLPHGNNDVVDNGAIH